MTTQDDHAGTKQLRDDSDRVKAAGRRLRDISDRILAEVDALRRLERQAREVPAGTPEFQRLSAEITARSRAIFNLAVEQEREGAETSSQATTIDELAGS